MKIRILEHDGKYRLQRRSWYNIGWVDCNRNGEYYHPEQFTRGCGHITVPTLLQAREYRSRILGPKVKPIKRWTVIE